MKERNETNEQLAMRVSRESIAGNVILSAFKLFAGIAAHSGAMISDSVHSLSDVLSTVVVMVGVKMSNKEPDKQHPYGHERFECVAALVLAAILFATGAAIGFAGVKKVIDGNYGDLSAPGTLALAAAVVSIVVKEAMYRYTKAAAEKIDSGALMADAWHHRSDAFSSVGSFAGILGARLGYPVLDAVAGIVICVFILKAAVEIFRDAVGKMTDRACDESTEKQMRELILCDKEVKDIDLLKTRLFGDRIYVDLEICMDKEISLEHAHRTAQRIHDLIENDFPKVKHCMVHVNPIGAHH